MSFRFDSKKGLIVIPTGIWDPNGDAIVMLALDTGATGSTINWDLLVLLGYDPAIIKDRVQMTTGSGVEYVPKIVVDKIKALGKEKKGFEFLCHTLPPSATVDGVLGLDFLRDGRLIIDFQKGIVNFQTFPG